MCVCEERKQIMSTIISKLSQRILEASKIVAKVPAIAEMMALKSSNKPEETCPAQQYILDRLNKLGIYDDEDDDILLSDDCQEGDARRVFCENGEPNLPIPRFKKIWKILKNINVVNENSTPENIKEEGSAIQKIVETMNANKPLGQWTDEELLENYGPDISSSIIDELHRRSKGRRFIMFKNEAEGIIDLEASLRMLKEARKRETPVHYKLSDSLKRTFIAGEFPSQVFYECPLHQGVLLFDGYCDKCGHTWEAVDYEVRQFVRIIVGCGEEPKENASVRQLINDARNGGIKSLSEDYPKSFVEFLDRQERDNLPSLKRRTATASSIKVKDPFYSQTNKNRY